ncbi:hypothetical protein BJ878DRAFT_230567 [Calycina marina]|uniref:Uncharacterized protein n=1 Tax=Calycina marina TaxID=1763456 RepID=A0A9P7YYE6_9HELO|nr:hypothetical protein BJ878DRAFT_230567 [Calycina marina]
MAAVTPSRQSREYCESPRLFNLRHSKVNKGILYLQAGYQQHHSPPILLFLRPGFTRVHIISRHKPRKQLLQESIIFLSHLLVNFGVPSKVLTRNKPSKQASRITISTFIMAHNRLQFPARYQSQLPHIRLRIAHLQGLGKPVFELEKAYMEAQASYSRICTSSKVITDAVLCDLEENLYLKEMFCWELIHPPGPNQGQLFQGVFPCKWPGKNTDPALVGAITHLASQDKRPVLMRIPPCNFSTQGIVV